MINGVLLHIWMSRQCFQSVTGQLKIQWHIPQRDVKTMSDRALFP
jgi:hypothetical protein